MDHHSLPIELISDLTLSSKGGCIWPHWVLERLWVVIIKRRYRNFQNKLIERINAFSCIGYWSSLLCYSEVIMLSFNTLLSIILVWRLQHEHSLTNLFSAFINSVHRLLCKWQSHGNIYFSRILRRFLWFFDCSSLEVNQYGPSDNTYRSDYSWRHRPAHSYGNFLFGIYQKQSLRDLHL